MKIHSMRHLLLLAISLILCQCSSIDPAKKASVKRIVVASNVGREVTRHSIGFTAFGNKEAAAIRSPELDRSIHKALREELSGKFQEVIFSPEAPPHVPSNPFAKHPDYKTWGQALAAKHKADAVFLITGRYYYPYGAPSYMTAEGLGLWHQGKVGQVQCYQLIHFLDAQTGKSLAHFSRYFNGRTLPNLEFKANFSDYSSTEQARIIQACTDEFRAELAAYLKGIGY